MKTEKNEKGVRSNLYLQKPVRRMLEAFSEKHHISYSAVANVALSVYLKVHEEEISGLKLKATT